MNVMICLALRSGILSRTSMLYCPSRELVTISVSMFAAAMVFAAPKVELSIYSTCKRISQKLLRNVQKFFSEMVEHNMASYGFKVAMPNSKVDMSSITSLTCMVYEFSSTSE